MLKKVGLIAGALWSLSAMQAQAQTVFNLSNVTLYSAAVGGTAQGTLTGSFTTNAALNAILSYNITASSFGSFTGFTYNSTTAPVTASVLPSQFFQLDSPGSQNELRLYFAAPLTASGTTLARTFSYESETSGGIRYAGGSIVAAAGAVPEPATWAMMIAGFGAVGFAMRRRKVTTSVTYAA